jgi:squalene-hopene/tetraprenyl-beta-curcumene cyclase
MPPAGQPVAPPATDEPTPTDDVNPAEVSLSLRLEAQAALDRGLKWLLAQQQEGGHWSTPEFPALTGLALWALLNGGSEDALAIEKAKAFLLSCVHEDGSIFRKPGEQRKGGGLANYNTAICMVALHALGNAELAPVIQAARRYLAGSQHFGDDRYEGGMGYDADTGRAYADLSNSYIAYEAMRLTGSRR